MDSRDSADRPEGEPDDSPCCWRGLNCFLTASTACSGCCWPDWLHAVWTNQVYLSIPLYSSNHVSATDW